MERREKNLKGTPAWIRIRAKSPLSCNYNGPGGFNFSFRPRRLVWFVVSLRFVYFHKWNYQVQISPVGQLRATMGVAELVCWCWCWGLLMPAHLVCSQFFYSNIIMVCSQSYNNRCVLTAHTPHPTFNHLLQANRTCQLDAEFYIASNRFLTAFAATTDITIWWKEL